MPANQFSSNHTMEAFSKDYAAFYDLFYQRKDYDHEVELIHRVVQDQRLGGRAVLDYGCGTGNHAGRLAALGYHVHGLDRNDNMLAVARQKLIGNPRTFFYNTSQRDLVAAGTMDLCICLFDVISYMNDNGEILDFFSYVSRSLKQGGLLIFDFWYGPGVLHLRPEKRWKQYADGSRVVLRMTDPQLDELNSVVHATHTLLVFEGERVVVRLSEKHSMRYFFKNEIALLLDRFGFESLRFGTWANLDGPPSVDDWSALTVARLAAKN